jgi:outer membrane lipoprotein-sorting protein
MSKWFICKDFITTPASFQRKLEPRPLSDATYFMARFLSFSLFYEKRKSGKSIGDLIRKATWLKGLASSFRWNDAREDGLPLRHANQFFSFGFVILLLLSLQSIASPEMLRQLTQKLNSIQTLQSKFVQTNPDGQMLEGTFYLQKPGKMRFAYSGPADFMLMADGEYLIYHDLAMNEAAYLDLDKNPLSILLKDYPDLNKIKDVQIKNISKEGGKTAVEVFYSQENTTVILHFNEQLILEGWITHDPQGTIIDVRLHDVVLNKPIANSEKLFSFDRLKLQRRGKGNRGN